MEISVLKTLEYHKIRVMLADKCSSIMGRELAENLIPSSELSEVEERIAETKEAREILDAMSSIPLGGIRDIRTLLKRAEIGSILAPDELVAVASTLYASRRMKNFFMDMPVALTILLSYAEKINVLRNVENFIENIVNEQGQIRDDASVELLHVRREIRLSQSRIKDKLDGILRSSEYQKYFQDALVTVRNERYVIPIKQEYRNHFPGIIHDQSASGATVFVEPMAVVILNNEIKQLTSAEKNEIERILRSATEQIANVAETIYLNCDMLANIDFAFAKAKLSLTMQATMPIISNKGYVNLRQARHPLIEAGVVVPIDIFIGKDFNTLLITGPNTGGKTVTLKTLGLFALMTQAGLYLPVQNGSEIAIFNNIFADIGDEQSIEQSLSTFSAHMTNLVRILNQITSEDLVLIDEIGAGTDPDEGAALAMSILEHLLNIGVKTIATTHYSELKTFAYSRQGIENASVEFDIHTLRPTYRLLIGVPGSSNAFAISKRLGLSDHIIEQASQFIDKDHAEFETVLNALEEQKIAYDKLHEEVIQQEQTLNVLREKLATEESILAEKKHKILTKAQEEAESLLRKTRRETEEIITELKAQFTVKNSSSIRQGIFDKSRKRLRENLEDLNNESEEDNPLPIATANILTPGMQVYVTTLKQNGTVVSIGTNEVIVQLGIMKMNVAIGDCRLVKEKAPIKKNNKDKNRDKNFMKIQEVARQIDIRGMMVEEAEYALGKYIDDAIVAGLTTVLVIHGKGTGALRKGVRTYLKNHHYVRDISIGELNEGGDGVTVVQL
ncbi:endonuclease MutS2 [Pelosinus propionicus]|uniref:Endonuclease MutS2 n=1 Tax=Pelosinus propionicus DSM 13327 TaxID=1123291 RepID=A0A1I4P7I0_9FIRM|nr:endonuclease MutS2 [Pelosinus propionicus]SFM23323.1 DNA mismatch repair protein MutS2 [Pelosinus propionicus DSM 13327]